LEKFDTKKFANLSDESLLEAYEQSEDPHLLGVLYQRYVHLIFGITAKYFQSTEEREEVTLEIFHLLHRKLKGRNVQNFPTWLLFVVKNHCISKHRYNFVRQRHQAHVLAETIAQHGYVENDGLARLLEEEGYNGAKWKAWVNKSMDQLNNPQQTCVRLFYFEEMSYREIAESTGYTEKEVKSHLQNGKRNLRVMWEQNEDF
jgi:RNA polymerase sigma-70 factor (ECF subfamily)